MAIRTCLFDLGNVLVHFSHARMCVQIAAVSGLDEDAVRGMLLETGLQWEFERGRVSETEFHRRFEEAASRRIPASELRRAACDIFSLNAPMLPVLDEIAASGRRLVLLSNTCVSHFEFVRERFDVLSRFDECVLSYRVGAVKPEPALFAAALETIGCEPAECFYTDDVAEYVESGRTHGLDAEVFTDAAALRRHLAARGLDVSG